MKNNAPGYDGVTKQIVADALPAIIYPLRYIFRTSLATGRFPTVWKDAQLTLIYKSGDPKEAANHRPISLLPQFSKMLESVVCCTFTSFLLRNNRIPLSQSGFRQGHSTESALMKLYSDMTDAIGRRKIYLLLSLDFSKAFDTVNHEILAVKLQHNGIRGTALAWFKDYLRNRSQQVVINGRTSQKRVVNTGVPQGSKLSPALFILFTSDLPFCLRNTVHYSYADDTQLGYAADLNNLSQAQAMLEEDFGRISQWSASNLLKLNAEKTCFFIAHSPRMHIPTVTLNLQGSAIKADKSVKVLGVTFDSHLTFERHADIIASKTSSFLRMLGARRKKIPRRVLIALCNAYVNSRLLYGLPILASVPAIPRRYQVLQNYAVRTIFGLSRFAHVSALRQQLRWNTVAQLAVMRFSVIMYKALNGVGPQYLFVRLANYAADHSFLTRASTLREPMVANEYGKRTFLYRCIQLYNKVSNRQTWIEPRNDFKQEMLRLAVEWFPG
jgi:hypothetical protein